MPFAYYKKLNARQRRTYDRSAAISTVRIPEPEQFTAAIEAIAAGLRADDRAATEAATQRFTRQLCEVLRVPRLQVRVLAKRPTRSWGELHGLYEPGEEQLPARLSVWMRTAQRHDVVAFRTFLRTLLHEIGHHLDYELFQLDDSLHTEGFYKRESSLFRQLVPEGSRFEMSARRPAARPAHAGAAASGETATGNTRKRRPSKAPSKKSPEKAAGRTPGTQRTLFDE